MKIRNYDSFDEMEEERTFIRKKPKKNECIEDRKDQKRYKKSKRINKDKFYSEE